MLAAALAFGVGYHLNAQLGLRHGRGTGVSMMVWLSRSVPVIVAITAQSGDFPKVG